MMWKVPSITIMIPANTIQPTQPDIPVAMGTL